MCYPSNLLEEDLPLAKAVIEMKDWIAVQKKDSLVKLLGRPGEFAQNMHSVTWLDDFELTCDHSAASQLRL